LHARQHAAMRVRDWTDDVGMTVLHAELPPEIGTPILTRLHRETDRIFRKASRDGRREPNEKYAAEALVRMLTTSGAGQSTTKADVVVVCDLNAYRRGSTEPGE